MILLMCSALLLRSLGRTQSTQRFLAALEIARPSPTSYPIPPAPATSAVDFRATFCYTVCIPSKKSALRASQRRYCICPSSVRLHSPAPSVCSRAHCTATPPAPTAEARPKKSSACTRKTAMTSWR